MSLPDPTSLSSGELAIRNIIDEFLSFVRDGNLPEVERRLGLVNTTELDDISLSEVSLSEGVRCGHLHIVKFFLERGTPYELEPIHIVQHLPILKFFVDERGADFRSRNEIWLRTAAACCCAESVRFLVERGADVNTGEMYDGELSTPLREAAYSRNRSICEFLLGHGAIPDFDWESVVENDEATTISWNGSTRERMLITKLNKNKMRTLRRTKQFECAICDDKTIGAPPEFIALRCEHVFHADCLKKWARSKGDDANCPLCRLSIVARGEDPESQTTEVFSHTA
jgi:hypothetical protein